VAKTIIRNEFITLVGGVVALLGLTVAATLRLSSFARYMRYEDLGLDVSPSVSPELFRQIVAPTPTDKALFYVALALAVVGVLLLVLAVMRRRMGGKAS
jgi:hypothetical protein